MREQTSRDIARIHDQYLRPPEGESNDCEHCEGTGTDPQKISFCCGAKFQEEDSDVCSACGKLAKLAECEVCDGHGYIEPSGPPED